MTEQAFSARKYTVCVILVNYNTAEDTVDCVRSIFENSEKPFTVIVDNGSKEKLLQERFDFYTDIKFIYNKDNIGFGRGNNLGIEWALANIDSKYIFLLNNDTVIEKDTIVKMIEPFDNDSSLGLTTCKIMYHYNPGMVWYGGGNINIIRGKQRTADFNKPASDNGANKSRYVTFASGCAMMFKRDVIEKTKGFDNRFFMYIEDLELCMRVQKMGYKIWYTAETQILHKVHASSDSSVKALPALHPDNPKLPFYMYHMVKNMLLTMNDHLTKKTMA